MHHGGHHAPSKGESKLHMPSCAWDSSQGIRSSQQQNNDEAQAIQASKLIIIRRLEQLEII